MASRHSPAGYGKAGRALPRSQGHSHTCAASTRGGGPGSHRATMGHRRWPDSFRQPLACASTAWASETSNLCSLAVALPRGLVSPEPTKDRGGSPRGDGWPQRHGAGWRRVRNSPDALADHVGGYRRRPRWLSYCAGRMADCCALFKKTTASSIERLFELASPKVL